LGIAERTARIPFRGAWRPSGGAAQQGGGRPGLASAMGPARLAPARVTVGKKRDAGKGDKV
jgi:hypothetical protein